MGIRHNITDEEMAAFKALCPRAVRVHFSETFLRLGVAAQFDDGLMHAVTRLNVTVMSIARPELLRTAALKLNEWHKDQISMPEPVKPADWQQRVIDEQKELEARRDRLAEFINAPSNPTGVVGMSVFGKLDIEEKKRLYIQLSIMNQYVRILDERITAFNL